MSLSPLTASLIFVGAGVGGVARAFLSLSLPALGSGTWLVNILGSLGIGIAAVTIPKDSLLGVCVITGFLGGFTTFSAFSWDLMQLVQGGEARLAFVFAIGTVTTCFAAAACGSWIGRSLL